MLGRELKNSTYSHGVLSQGFLKSVYKVGVFRFNVRDFDSAETCFKLCKSISKHLDLLDVKAICYYNLFLIETHRSNLDKAIIITKKAFALFLDLDKDLIRKEDLSKVIRFYKKTLIGDELFLKLFGLYWFSLDHIKASFYLKKVSSGKREDLLQRLRRFEVNDFGKNRPFMPKIEEGVEGSEDVIPRAS